MTNWDMYRLANFIANNDELAQAMGVTDFGLELAAKSMRHFRNRIGLPEAYRQGQIVAGVESTRLNNSDLVPFLRDGIEITISGGKAVLPGWYYILDYWSDTSRSSEIITYGEYSRRRTGLKAPTTKDLVAYIVADGLKVFPITGVTKVYVTYYRKPATPKFVTTVNQTTLKLEYNANDSVELEWDDGNKLDILHMILTDYGLNIERGDVVQIAEKFVETGK